MHFSKFLLILPNFPKSYIKFLFSSYTDCTLFLLQNRAYSSGNTFTAKATQATDASALPRKALRLLNGHLNFFLLYQPGLFYYYYFFFPSDLIIYLSWHRKLLKGTEELKQNNRIILFPCILQKSWTETWPMYALCKHKSKAPKWENCVVCGEDV